MYDYRKMTAEQRREAVEYRRLQRRPWHAPPHWEFTGECQFIISGACYEHNPVHHGYVQRWQDWVWSSASEYLERVGTETAAKIWRKYPVLGFGKNWDVD